MDTSQMAAIKQQNRNILRSDVEEGLGECFRHTETYTSRRTSISLLRFTGSLFTPVTKAINVYACSDSALARSQTAFARRTGECSLATRDYSST